MIDHASRFRGMQARRSENIPRLCSIDPWKIKSNHDGNEGLCFWDSPTKHRAHFSRSIGGHDLNDLPCVFMGMYCGMHSASFSEGLFTEHVGLVLPKRDIFFFSFFFLQPVVQRQPE